MIEQTPEELMEAMTHEELAACYLELRLQAHKLEQMLQQMSLLNLEAQGNA